MKNFSASLISTYKITNIILKLIGENQNIETHFVDADV